MPGTRFHAQATVSCRSAYTQIRECTAGVVRCGFDGGERFEIPEPLVLGG